MKTSQINIIKEVIQLLEINIFPVVNRLKDDVEAKECIKIILQCVDKLNKVTIDTPSVEEHSKSSREFAKSQEAFLKFLIQKIEDRDLRGGIMLQTPKEEIDVFMSTMDENQLIQAISAIFINYNPTVFMRFIQKMLNQLGINFEMVGIDPFNQLSNSEANSEEDKDNEPSL